MAQFDEGELLSLITSLTSAIREVRDAIKNADATVSSLAGAPVGSSYIVVTTDSTLTSERALKGTASQITVTDGGAGGNITLSIPSSPTFTTPTIDDLTNATHDHQNAAGGGATLTSPTVVTPTIAATGWTSANHAHAAANSGGTIATHTTAHAHSATTGQGTDDHHPQSHTVASHSDTTGTGAELETLTDGSDASALHTHAGLTLVMLDGGTEKVSVTTTTTWTNIDISGQTGANTATHAIFYVHASHDADAAQIDTISVEFRVDGSSATTNVFGLEMETEDAANNSESTQSANVIVALSSEICEYQTTISAASPASVVIDLMGYFHS